MKPTQVVFDERTPPPSRLPGIYRHYRIGDGVTVAPSLDLLGRGLLGSVWAASSERYPGVGLAIKFLALPSPDWLHREAELALRLHHERIARTFEFLDLQACEARAGEWQEDWTGAAIVMERYSVSLETVLSSLKRKNETLPVQLALQYLHDVARALKELHAIGWAHRDVKPSNILLRLPENRLFNGRASSLVGSRAVLADFGVAVPFAAEGVCGLREDGYKAPEVLNREDRRYYSSPAQDVYAFGRVLAALEALFPSEDSLTDEAPLRYSQDRFFLLRSLCLGPATDRPTVQAIEESIATIASVGEREQKQSGKPIEVVQEIAGAPRVPGFQIVEVLGRGGLGVVYRALELSTNRFVALKCLLNANSELVRLFRVEVLALSRLEHPNFVRLYAAGEHEGMPYLVLEFLREGNLAQRLRDRPLEGPHAGAKLLAEIAQAVHFFHEQGIIHRNLKPSNILLGPDGAWRVAGFGLALFLDEVLPELGLPVGTPPYMAPEQFSRRKIDRRADVWALGVILYEMITGRGPVRRDNFDFANHRMPSPRSLRADVPADLERICLKCLEIDPNDRYQTARALANDLERWARGVSLDAGTHSRAKGRSGPDKLSKFWRWCSQSPVVAFLSLALTASLLVCVILVYLLLRKCNPPPKKELVLEPGVEGARLDSSEGPFRP